ncbi:efflux RND transporter periplasmic adaptor subunit [Patescibacteria group bacterium]|nr:efflux RND transporter periplasmic adaptor subunit [Patescibacteria group bacterium]
MKRLLRFFSIQNAGIALVVAAVFGGLVYVYVQNSKTPEQLLTVTSGTFIQSVSVSGKVEALRDVDLGFTQGGRVARVSGAVGEKVSAGSVLAEVENGDVLALVSQREAALLVAEAELASLKVGTRSEEIAVAEADVRAKQIALEQAALSVREELQDAYTTADNSIKTKVDQFFTTPSGATPQLSFSVSNSNIKTLVESERKTIGNLLSEWGVNVESTSTSTIASLIVVAKQNLAAVSSFLSDANTAVSQGITGGSITQAVLNGYGVDVGTARTNVNTALSALTTAETAWVNAEAALGTAERSLALKKAGASVEDIAAQEARVKSARAAVLDAEAQLRKTRIVAPFSGTITAVNVKTGEVAQSNTPVISMITASELLVESYIPEINVALVSPQDTADITLDAYGTEVVFPGFVESIDPAETVRDGASTYRMLLKFADADSRIRPGMTANIVITADRREGVISVPQKLVVSRGGKRFVTVKKNEMYEEREVVLGAVSSLGTVEIVSGLKDSEQVVVKKSE